jgi:hypothetical protein
MRIKRTIIAPLIMTIGSAGLVAGFVAPIVASSSAAVGVVAASPSPSMIGVGA